MVQRKRATDEASQAGSQRTWLIDQKKSNAGAVTDQPDLPIKIAHHDPEFRIVLSFQSGGKVIERELVFFTDNRGEVNGATGVLMEKPLPDQVDDPRFAKSKTKWNGDSIVTRRKIRPRVAGDIVEVTQIVEWVLSDNGRILTQTSSVVFEGSDIIVENQIRVYNRF